MSPDNPETRPAAIVTGAGSGIGAAIALELAGRGYRLALVGRTASKLAVVGARLGEEGTDWVALPTDLARTARAGGVVDLAVEAFGRLDALVNNAGYTPLRPLHETSDREIEEILAVNLTGPLASIRRALPVMLAAGGGVIAGVSSMAAFDPFPGLGVYGAAKAGLNTLSRAIANEYGAMGIRAYTVAPGAVETPMLRALFSPEALPPGRCLEPGAVARVIAGCVTGMTDEPNGATIRLPSP